MLAVSLLLLASTSVTHGDLSQFRDNVVNQPSEAMKEYATFVKQLENDYSEGAFTIHRYALVAASELSDIASVVSITQTLSSESFNNVGHNHIARVLLSIGATYRIAHQYDEALQHYQCAMKHSSEPDTQNALIINTAILYRKLQKPRETRRMLDLLKDEQLDTRVKAAQAVIHGNLLLAEARYEEALGSFQQSLRFYKQRGDYQNAAHVISNILLTTLLMDDLASYQRYYNALTTMRTHQKDAIFDSYLTLLELTRQYKEGHIDKARYLQDTPALLTQLDADALDDLELIKTMAPAEFNPQLEHVKTLQWPASLGKHWCNFPVK